MHATSGSQPEMASRAPNDISFHISAKQPHAFSPDGLCDPENARSLQVPGQLLECISEPKRGGGGVCAWATNFIFLETFFQSKSESAPLTLVEKGPVGAGRGGLGPSGVRGEAVSTPPSRPLFCYWSSISFLLRLPLTREERNRLNFVFKFIKYPFSIYYVPGIAVSTWGERII